MIVVRKNGNHLLTLSDGDTLKYGSIPFAHVVVRRNGQSTTVLDEIPETPTYNVAVFKDKTEYWKNGDSFEDIYFSMQSIDLSVDFPNSAFSEESFEIEIQLDDFVINDEFNREWARFGGSKIKSVVAMIDRNSLEGAYISGTNSTTIYTYESHTGANNPMGGLTLTVPAESSQDVYFTLILNFKTA